MNPEIRKICEDQIRSMRKSADELQALIDADQKQPTMQEALGMPWRMDPYPMDASGLTLNRPAQMHAGCIASELICEAYDGEGRLKPGFWESPDAMRDFGRRLAAVAKGESDAK